jgi:hypothetical protein
VPITVYHYHPSLIFTSKTEVESLTVPHLKCWLLASLTNNYLAKYYCNDKRSSLSCYSINDDKKVFMGLKSGIAKKGLKLPKERFDSIQLKKFVIKLFYFSSILRQNKLERSQSNICWHGKYITL